MDLEKKKELLKLMEVIEERKKNYGIVDTKLQEHQAQVIPIIRETVEVGWVIIPRYKYLLYQGWNGSGKTFTMMYILACLALGDLTSQYKLPYLWDKKVIWLVTKSGINITSTLEPYLLWDYSKARIPPEAIAKEKRDNGILKQIELKNGNKIILLTYDQGRDRLQWGSPDAIFIDEEPVDQWVWDELMIRARKKTTQLFLSMTPLSWFTPVYTFFYEYDTPEWELDRRYTFLVSSLENKHADHSGLLMLPEQEKKARMYGQFVPTTWLVFYAFNRREHLVPHFDPKELWYGTKYYAWLDFWVEHPTAFVLVALDTDWRLYIFDWFCESSLYLSDIASKITELKRRYEIDLEYIIADSAGKRERTELAKLWISTTPADKFNKGENGESNRKAWILKVNQLLHDNKLFISDKLSKNLVRELEVHHYLWKWKDWAVVKEDDDFIDALRYVIFSLKPTKIKTRAQEKFEQKYNQKHNKANYYPSLYKQSY